MPSITDQPLPTTNLNSDSIHRPIIVGAGPSGLAVAACLHQNGVASLILERSNCLASLWQQRTYDRLTLHLPKQFCQLPFLNFPQNYPKYPSKQQFIAYVELYAKHFSIGPKFDQTVVRAEPDLVIGLWRVKTQDCLYFTKFLVVATGENSEPVIPEIEGLAGFGGPVVHTCDYKSGFEFRNQRVLVVGCGNSGMEVCLDLCSHNASPHMVVRNSVHVLPREVLGVSIFTLAMALLKWLPLRVVDMLLLVLATFTLGKTERLGLPRPKIGPIGLKNATGKTPVLDVGALEQIKSGKIKVMEGVREITKGGAKFVDGQEKEFDSIILATGYKSNVPTWLKVRILNKKYYHGAVLADAKRVDRGLNFSQKKECRRQIFLTAGGETTACTSSGLHGGGSPELHRMQSRLLQTLLINLACRSSCESCDGRISCNRNTLELYKL